MKRNLIFVLMLTLTVTFTTTAFAGNKKFNICLQVDEVASIIKYSGLELEARCEAYGSDESRRLATIAFISTTSNTKTTRGFWPDPAEGVVLGWAGTGCSNDTSAKEGASMISEKGNYLAIDGQTLILCGNVGDCDCSFTGVAQKEKIKLK